MTTHTLVDAFGAADDAGLPSLPGLDERRQMFWVLRIAQEQLGVSAMTPTEISTVLRDVHGILVTRQRIEATLTAERGTVASRKKNRRRAYQLMASGSQELDAAGNAVVFIDPTSAFSGLREVHSLLAALRGEVRVCDPYADTRTLDMLAECQLADSIRLLTRNVNKPNGFEQALNAFGKEHGVPIEVRKAPAGLLHDRYAIHEDGMLVFGTSLNGLGLKQSFVVALGEDIRATVLGAFETTWDDAAAL